MRVICFVSDKYLWALRGYAHQMAKYWPGVPVAVAGFSEPDFDLPGNFEFHSIGDFADYPVDRWSDAVIKFLSSVTDELFVLMLEDYWLTRTVDTRAIRLLEGLMMNRDGIARIDLTGDRLYAENLREWGALSHIDLITNEPYAPYTMSLQAGIWRRVELLRYLRPGESAWETEINGSNRMTENRAVVLGTRQFPVRYLIAVQQGVLKLDGGYQVPKPYMRKDDVIELSSFVPPQTEGLLISNSLGIATEYA